MGQGAESRVLRRPGLRPARPTHQAHQPLARTRTCQHPQHGARGTPGLRVPGRVTRALRKWRHSVRVARRRFRKQSRGWLDGECVVETLGSVLFVCSRARPGGRGPPTAGRAGSVGADAPLRRTGPGSRGPREASGPPGCRSRSGRPPGLRSGLEPEPGGPGAAQCVLGLEETRPNGGLGVEFTCLSSSPRAGGSRETSGVTAAQVTEMQV